MTTDPPELRRRAPRAKYLSTAAPTSNPVPVDEILPAVYQRYAGPAGIAAAALIDDWQTLGGDEWGRRARALSVRDGVLVLEVDDGATATLLRYDEGAIRARIGARFGPDLVRSVRVRVAPSAGRR